MTVTGSTFSKFVDVIRALRDPQGGCPWDLEQTHSSIRPYLLEEAYEVLDAIDKADDHAFAEELGDLLLQVVLHAQIAKDRGAFQINDVVQLVTEKMIRRHPHVFGDKSVQGTAEVLKNWETIKSQEREQKLGSDKEIKPSLLDGIPTELPALLRAQRVGEKATRVGFDWQSISGVWAKVEEELEELRVEVNSLQTTLPEGHSKPFTTAPKHRDPELQKRLEHELGDLLFSACQLSRWLGISAEDALRGTIERFTRRFRSMEKSNNYSLKELSESELEQAWEHAKKTLE